MMHRRSKIAALLAVALLTGSGYAAAEEDFWDWLLTFQRQKNFKPVTDKVYLEGRVTSPTRPACCRPGHGKRC
jgi:hypothetical protein